MGRFALEETFSTILIPGNSLLHLLTVQDQVQCLTCVGRHLGRRRTVGAPHRQPGRARAGMRPLGSDPAFRINKPPRGEGSVEETASYDAATHARHIRWNFPAPNASDFRCDRLPAACDLSRRAIAVVRATGFQLEARFGEFSRAPLESPSLARFRVCTAKSQRSDVLLYAPRGARSQVEWSSEGGDQS